MISYKMLLPLSTLLLVFTACTGTTEEWPTLRLMLLLNEGTQLAYADLNETDRPTLKSEPIAPSTSILSQSGQVLVNQPEHVISINPALQKKTLWKLEKASLNCKFLWAMNEAKNRVATLQECGAGGSVVSLYHNNGSLIWKLELPPRPLVTGYHLPPLLLAVKGEQVVMVRPTLAGGSEARQAFFRKSDNPSEGSQAVISDPLILGEPVWDISTLGEVYAATNNGIKPLTDTGLGQALNTYSSSRAEKVWGVNQGQGRYLVAWFKEENSTLGEAWVNEGNLKGTARSLGYLPSLRDVQLFPDGNLYLLTSTQLLSYDPLTWKSRSLLEGLRGASSLGWLVMPLKN